MAITEDPTGTASVSEDDDVVRFPVAEVLTTLAAESPLKHTGTAYGCPVCAAAAKA